MPRIRKVLIVLVSVTLFTAVTARAASHPIRVPQVSALGPAEARTGEIPSPRSTVAASRHPRSAGLPEAKNGHPGSGNAPPYTGSHLALWLCIHSYEGSWTDPNPPYWGGLQMGWGFQEAYAPGLLATLGTADHWSSSQQIAVAENAWKLNGYSVAWLTSQWPISGRNCA